jgi:hypothetical protein
MAYQLALPDPLRSMHDVFHVSVLCHYISYPSHVIDMSSLKVLNKVSLIVDPIYILDHHTSHIRHRLVFSSNLSRIVIFHIMPLGRMHMRWVNSFHIYFEIFIDKLVSPILFISLLESANFETKSKTRGGVCNIRIFTGEIFITDIIL